MLHQSFGQDMNGCTNPHTYNAFARCHKLHNMLLFCDTRTVRTSDRTGNQDWRVRVPGSGLWWGPFGCACQLVPGHALGVYNKHVILVVATIIHTPKNEQAAIREGGAAVP